MALRLFKILFIGFCFILLSSFYPEDNEQKIKYSIMYGNSKVGTLHAKQFVENGKTHYEIKSDIKARLIKMFHVVFRLNVVFNRDFMVKARVKNVVNDEIWDKSNIRWKGNCYRIKKDEEDPYQLCHNKARYSTACLYFRAPKGRSELFSENYANFIPIEEKSSGKYALKLPSGNTNYYYYDNKSLQKAIINDAMVQLKFVKE